MRQTEIEQLREVRAFLKDQLETPFVERSMSALVWNLDRKPGFSHYSSERLWSMIKETVLVYNEDFKINRATGMISRHGTAWWTAPRSASMTHAGMIGEALERKEA